jgi:hypothetical protein
MTGTVGGCGPAVRQGSRQVDRRGRGEEGDIYLAGAGRLGWERPKRAGRGAGSWSPALPAAPAAASR